MDDADRNDEQQAFIDEQKKRQYAARAMIDPGKPGDCDLCGEWSQRLVRGACCPCRDRHKLG